jgi:actin-like ATPase involved in cell morphogenesis
LDQSVSAFTAKPLTLSFDADTDSAAEKLKELEKPIVLQFDTSQLDQAIAEMQTDIANSFVGGSGGPGGLGGDGGAGGEGGQGGDASLGTLQRIVETIKTVLEKIEPKLPTAALTA